MDRILLIALAGAIGTLARYGLCGLVQRVAGEVFPWSTLAVNVVGCFLFGLIWSLSEERFPLSPDVRTVVLVGFMGAFTTFSTFAFETGEMLHNARYVMAVGNLVAANVVGILSLGLGLTVGRGLWPGW